MPTVIDELVTILRLDPSQFTSGQQQFLRNLQGMRTQAQNAAGQINQTTGRSVKDFLSQIHQELRDVNLSLAQLGAQSRRQGSSIKSGADTGAVGLRNLAEAGLAAYAAIKSVHEAIQQVGSVASKTFQTERAAAFSGISVQSMQRLQIANQIVSGISHEETQGALTSFEASRAAYRTSGQYPQEFIALARFFGMAPQDLANMPLDQLLAMVAQRVKENPASIPNMRSMLTAAGLGSFTTLLTSGRFDSAMSNAGKFTLDDRQVKNLTDLAEAARQLAESWDKLVAAIVAQNPEMTAAINKLSEFMLKITEDPKKLEALGKAFEFVFAVVMVNAVRAFVAAVLAANARLIATPLGRMIMLGYMAYSDFGRTPTQEESQAHSDDWTSFLDPRRWFGIGPYGKPEGHSEPGGLWGSVKRFFGGGSSPSSSSSTAPGPMSPSVEEAFRQANLDPAAAAYMRAVAAGEATDFQQLAHHGPGSANAYGDDPNVGGHFPAWEGTSNPPYGTSHGYGLFQDERSTARSIVREGGFDNIRDPVQQIRGNWWWAQKVYRENSGGRDLLADIKSGNISPSGRAALGGQWARGMSALDVAAAAARTAPAQAVDARAPKMSVDEALALQNQIFGVTRTTNTTTGNVSNDNSVDTNVHAPITVHGATPENAYKMGGALADGLMRRMLANSANNGLQ